LYIFMQISVSDMENLVSIEGLLQKKAQFYTGAVVVILLIIELFIYLSILLVVTTSAVTSAEEENVIESYK